jgi:Tfp pilus assembly protein PilN
MNYTIMFLSLINIFFLVVGFYLYVTIELLKARIKVLQDNNVLLDGEITRLTAKVHKNQHNIEKSLESQKQLPNKKQLLKG